MRDATKILRAMVTPAMAGEPLHEGPVFAAPFHVPGAVDEATYSYARYQQPNWTTLERVLELIETGDGLPGKVEARALCFGSGMAATAAVFGAVLRPGDAVVLPTGGYFTARVLAEEYFRAMGVEVRSAPVTDELQGEFLEGARLLWIESPSNPGMEVCDIAALCERAHRAGVLVACDNTTATPMGQNVLALGADFSVVSDTKLMTGHSDLLMGHVAVTDEVWYGKLLSWRNLTGGGPGPMEAWLATRSLATLPLRLERSTANALRVAEWMEARPEVRSVRYPGLMSHEAYATARRQMRSFGPVVSFALETGAKAEEFLREARLVSNATSFGGITTTAERRTRWGHDAVEEGFIRMSVGCEAVEDLLEDFGRAMEGD
jgi:cystathionine gamma-lyase